MILHGICKSSYDNHEHTNYAIQFIDRNAIF